MAARVFRPRVLAYCAILAGIVAAAAVSLALRVPLKVDVIRDRTVIAREVEGGAIENVCSLQIMNTAEAARVFEIAAAGLPGLSVAGETRVAVGPAASRTVALRLRIGPGQAGAGKHKIEFAVRATDDEAVAVREKSVFIVR